MLQGRKAYRLDMYSIKPKICRNTKSRLESASAEAHAAGQKCTHDDLQGQSCGHEPLAVWGQHLLDEPLAALMSSSARHSAMVLMLRNDASRAPVVRR